MYTVSSVYYISKLYIFLRGSSLSIFKKLIYLLNYGKRFGEVKEFLFEIYISFGSVCCITKRIYKEEKKIKIKNLFKFKLIDLMDLMEQTRQQRLLNYEMKSNIMRKLKSRILTKLLILTIRSQNLKKKKHLIIKENASNKVCRRTIFPYNISNVFYLTNLFLSYLYVLSLGYNGDKCHIIHWLKELQG